MVKTKNPSAIQLFPRNREACRKELSIHKNHKWLFLILDPKLAGGIREFLKYFFDPKKSMILIDGDKQFEMFMGKHELDWRKFVNFTGMDGGVVSFREMTITSKEGKEKIIYFLFAGMDEKEIQKHYDNFIRRLRKMFEAKDKKGVKK